MLGCWCGLTIELNRPKGPRGTDDDNRFNERHQCRQPLGVGFERSVRPHLPGARQGMKAQGKAKGCCNCAHYGTQRKGGGIIGPTCKGEQGKRWAPSVALKEGRCGSRRLWWAARVA